MNQTQTVIEPGNHAITHIRTFEAPVDLTFKAWTEPSLLAQWWGPENMTTTIEAVVKPGGLWRYVVSGGGQEFAFNGVYHAVAPSQSLVQTFEFEGMPGHVALETVTFGNETFQNETGKTLVTDILVFQSVEDRDAWIASGMEEGLPESWDLFAKLLARLQQ